MENFFDRDLYSNWVKNAHPLVKEFLEKENEFLRKFLKSNSVILDVGCGYGRTITAISDIPTKIYGIDNSREMVKRAKENLKHLKNVEIFLQDAVKMNFEDNSIDSCLCMASTFGNLDEKKIPALKEMKRVTKPRGNILLGLYLPGSMPYRIESYKNAGMEVRVIDSKTLISNDGLKFEEFSEEDLQKMFGQVGLNYEIKKLNEISYICVLTHP